MMYKELAFTTVVVGALSGKSSSMTAEVIVPFLTNEVEIPPKAELLLRVDEQAAKAKKGNTWKESVAQAEKDAQKKQNKSKSSIMEI